MLTQKIRVKLQELIKQCKGIGEPSRKDVLTQISYLLFLRWLSNCRDNVINNTLLPGILAKHEFQRIRWDIFCHVSTIERYELYHNYVNIFLRSRDFASNIVKDYPHTYVNLIDSPEQLDVIVSLINEVFDMAKDIGMDCISANGEVYEYLLNECYNIQKQDRLRLA